MNQSLSFLNLLSGRRSPEEQPEPLRHISGSKSSNEEQLQPSTEATLNPSKAAAKPRGLKPFMLRGNRSGKSKGPLTGLSTRVSKDLSEPEREGPGNLDDIEVELVDVDVNSVEEEEEIRGKDILELPRYEEVLWSMPPPPSVSGSRVTSCCCFIVCWILTIIFTGVILMEVEESYDKPIAFAGSVVLYVGVLALLVCCFTVTFGTCVGSCLGAPRANNKHKDLKQADLQWSLIRINDRYKTNQLSRVNNWRPIPYPGMKLDCETAPVAPSAQMIMEGAMKGSSLRELYSRVSPCVFLIYFNGSGFDDFRSQVSFTLAMAAPNDKVCVLLTSPGGGVAIYGYASAQLVRIKNANLHLTVCVDLMAASGGYMMACVGDEICAAPFSYVGSIGVVAQITNYEELLNKHGVETTVFTAGEYKRTVNTVGKMTEEGKAKFQENLESIHTAFKNHVATYRGDKIKDIEKLATGEDWLASEALELGLVDRLCTSDEWIEEHFKEFNVLEFQRAKRKLWPAGDSGRARFEWLKTLFHDLVDDIKYNFLRLPRSDEQYQVVPQDGHNAIDLA